MCGQAKTGGGTASAGGGEGRTQGAGGDPVSAGVRVNVACGSAVAGGGAASASVVFILLSDGGCLDDVQVTVRVWLLWCVSGFLWIPVRWNVNRGYIL